MCVCVIRVGVEGTRHHPAGVHALLDSVLRRQRRHGPLSLLPAPVVRRHGRGDAGRLVGLRLSPSLSLSLAFGATPRKRRLRNDPGPDLENILRFIVRLSSVYRTIDLRQ